jgi:hypothetical protein
MKRYIAAGGTALIAIAGSVGYLVSESNSNAPLDTGMGGRIIKEAEKPEPKKAEPKPAATVTPAERNARRIEAKITQVKIGASYAEVVEIMGAADWSEEQSTDFGHDVIYWYGGWAVYTTDYTVTSVTYYDSEA